MTETQPNLPACEIGLRTDPGRDPDKQVNEDSATYVETSLGLLAIVCDGMGGHAGGKEASELAVRAIVEEVQNAPPGAPHGDVLRAAITEANTRIWNMPTAEAGLRPGSTVVVVLIHEGGAEIAHVGDSRVYLVHAGAISQVTRDHSMVQELVDRNLIKAEDASKHPDANKILRALGIAKDVEADVRPDPIPYVAGDIFILCSDGLSDLATAGDILEVAGSLPPAQAAGRLVDLANARGGHDNITALVVRTKVSARPSAAPTLVKTMPLTAAPARAMVPPPAQGAAPGATLVAAPLHPAAHAAPGAVSPPPAPIHDEAHPTSERPHRARTPVIVALALALIALAALALFWINRKETHRPVPIVDEAPREAGPAEPLEPQEDEDDLLPPIASVPPLAPPPPTTTPTSTSDGGRVADAGAQRPASTFDASPY